MLGAPGELGVCVSLPHDGGRCVSTEASGPGGAGVTGLVVRPEPGDAQGGHAARPGGRDPRGDPPGRLLFLWLSTRGARPGCCCSHTAPPLPTLLLFPVQVRVAVSSGDLVTEAG